MIANPEAGVLSIRATSRQHARIQEFLDQVLANAKRQVLIEATVAEVQLNNQYQRGIDWSKLRTGSAGFQFQQSSAGTPAGINTNAFVVGYALGNYNFTSAVKLLESFGSVRVLSSPKISVLNNQAAVMRVTDDLVYFTLQPGTTTVSAAGGGTVVAPSDVHHHAERLAGRADHQRDSADQRFGRCSARRAAHHPAQDRRRQRPQSGARGGRRGEPDPGHPDARNGIGAAGAKRPDRRTGRLMQDSVSNTEDTIPGVNRIPGIGSLFEQRKDLNQKTELVIFLRSTVVNDPSVNGDFRDFRSLLPGKDYFSKPNPGRPDAIE